MADGSDQPVLVPARPWRPIQTQPPIVTHWVEANLVSFRHQARGRLVKTQDLLGQDQEMTRDTLFKVGFELWSLGPKKSETTQTRICGMFTDQVLVPAVLQEVRPLTGSPALKTSWFVSSECQIRRPPGDPGVGGRGGGGVRTTRLASDPAHASTGFVFPISISVSR